MRASLLSPRVIERILRNEPIIHRGCLHRRAARLRTAYPRPTTTQRRTLFGWLSPVPREAVLATGERASLTYLKEACTRLDNEVRPPPAEDMAKAWVTLVRERRRRHGRFNDGEALAAARVFELLKTMVDNEGVNGSTKLRDVIPGESLWLGLECVENEVGAETTKEAANAYLMLSRMLFEEARARVARQDAASETGLREHMQDIWQMHIGALVMYGRTGDARDLLTALPPGEFTSVEELWLSLLRQMEKHSKDIQDADKLPALIQQQLSTLPDTLKKGLSAFYASTGNTSLAQKYTLIQPSEDGTFDTSYLASLLTSCRRHNDLAWGRSIIKTITANATAMRSQKRLWNMLFAFALGSGKSVDEISRMMDVMRKTNPEFMPTTADVNELLLIANERADPYMAERLVALGEKWGCTPDETTYLLQMDYRLSVGDVEGARVAFDLVRSFRDTSDVASEADPGPAVNKLVQAMCTRTQYAFETIMETVDFLGQRGSKFEASTVAALAILHLNRDEYTDVADLLSTHTKDFSRTERASIRAAILDLMLDSSTPVARLWDTYMIFQHIFEDAPRADRIAIMTSFFDRKRSDMAIHVFNHMRRHASPLVNPDANTYVAALIGCGATRDDEALGVVNNVLKLDIGITETTRLHNARMLAFYQTGSPDRAQKCWDDIVRSEEGPSRNSLVLLMRVCEESDFGEVRARGVWELIRRMDVPLDGEVVAAYVGALGGNGCEDEARKVIEQCDAGTLGTVGVDELILAKLFNAAFTRTRQDELEKWIAERYPAIWARLAAKGFKMRFNDTRVLPLDVRMEP